MTALIAASNAATAVTAFEMSSGAESILEAAKLFETTQKATADLQRLYATSARVRDMVKPGLTMREAAHAWRGHARDSERCGDGRFRAIRFRAQTICDEFAAKRPSRPMTIRYSATM